MNLVVLVENSVQVRGLRAEHGLAWLLERGGRHVLFDTGQTELIGENATELGCTLDQLDAVLLSHGHYDHTGGLAWVCCRSPRARILLHPEAARPKFAANSDGSSRFVGMSEEGRRVLDAEAGRVVLTSGCRELVPGMFTTGVIPRETEFEDAGGPFFLDADLKEPDAVMDDQAVFIPTRDGTVVVLGCAHAGMINTLRHVQRLTGGARIRAVLGGMHLMNASAARMDATVRALQGLDVPLLVPAHCTGLRATVRLWESLPGRCAGLGVGSRFTFD